MLLETSFPDRLQTVLFRAFLVILSLELFLMWAMAAWCCQAFCESERAAPMPSNMACKSQNWLKEAWWCKAGEYKRVPLPFSRLWGLTPRREEESDAVSNEGGTVWRNCWKDTMKGQGSFLRKMLSSAHWVWKRIPIFSGLQREERDTEDILGPSSKEELWLRGELYGLWPTSCPEHWMYP